jgi:hypothetical protein
MDQEHDDYAEPEPPARPVRMLTVLLVAAGIVTWCIVAVFVLSMGRIDD